ncbi:MAG: TIGR00730 family Rossman fold protein [Candidatus Magasanikbacteria bacterium]|nr:TIGR00730 family Rossman fold protein [Candidatus Magasanikbacteria bacterium]
MTPINRGSAIDLRGSAWSVFRIMAEFVEGYQFLSQLSRQVTVMGSARTFPNSPYYLAAVEMGKLLAKNKFTVLTGGGPGIMEAANRGAYENGGDSVGINIELPHEQRLNPFIHKSLGCYYFLTRKVFLTAPAQAFVMFPGGFGTLDELFEILDQIRSGMLTRVPVILFGKSYWEPLIHFLNNNVFERIHALTDDDMSMVFIADSPEEAMDIIRQTKPIEKVCSMDARQFCSDDAINWRVFRIMAELVEGFEFLQNIGSVITVLGTPRVKLESSYYKDAYYLGQALGKKNLGVVTGGGAGIAEAANKGAYETGAGSYGMDMWVDRQERINPYVTKSRNFYFPFTRKLMLTTPSKGFVFFPGGYGTLNNCFELLTLIQTGKIPKIPVVLYGKEFWEPLLLFIKENQFEREHTIDAEDMNLYHIADTPEEVMKILNV